MDSPNLTPGLDCSHHNGEFDWQGAWEAGKRFCFIKCTEGTKYFDPQFARNWLVSWRLGFVVGAYHFFHPMQDPIQQANYFLRVKGPTATGELPPVLDFESLDGMGARASVGNAWLFLNAITQATGRTPIVYASPGFIEGLLGLEGFEKYPLWVAHYGVSQPRVPAPWTKWTFWQTSDANGLDVDLFNGDEAALKSLVGL